jgi:hypothetical protein
MLLHNGPLQESNDFRGLEREDVEWIKMAQDRGQRLALVNILMKLRVTKFPEIS